MPLPPRSPSTHDYFRYLPREKSSEAWGLAVTAAGFTEVPAGKPYPPARHPDDHEFDWSTGRTLPALQIVSIQAGKGWFETKATGLRRISAGSAFLILPHVWHRYRPDPGTGWTESWVEMQGSLIERLIRARQLPRKRMLKNGVATSKLDEALNALHVRMRESGARFDPAIAAGAFEILASWVSIGRATTPGSFTTQKIVEAEHYLSVHFAEPIAMKSFAGSHGMGYSHFRKLFRAHTGYAPWAYVIRLRLMQARRLLLQTSAKLDAIASELGFGSAFHLSAAFKKAFGESPNAWRMKHVGGRCRHLERRS